MIRYVAALCVVGCGSAPGVLDAGRDAADVGSDTHTFDAALGDCSDVCFAWDGWPSGAVAYRVERTRCNFSGARAGECPDGFVCGDPIDVRFDALTRGEPVCEPTGALELGARVDAPAPELEAPLDVALHFSIGEGWPGGEGDVRIVDASGEERFAGPVPGDGRLVVRLDRGEHALAARFGSRVGRDGLPPWFRTGRLSVAASGEVDVVLERAWLALVDGPEGEHTLVLDSERVGQVLVADGMLEGRIALVPAEYRATLRDEVTGGETSLGNLDLREDATLSLAAPVFALEGSARIDGEPVTGEIVFRDPVDGRIGARLPAVAGAYEGSVFAGRYEVYVGASGERGVATEITVDAARNLDLDVSRVPFEGVLSLDGAAAPAAERRLGYLALHDALGAALPGVDVNAGDGHFEARVPSGRYDLVFHATHPAMPRPGAVVAREMAPSAGTRVDIQSAVVTLDLDDPTRAGGTLIVSHPEQPALEGRFPVENGDSVVLAAGRWLLRFEHPILGHVDLGERDLTGSTTLRIPLRALRVTLDLIDAVPVPDGNRGVVQFRAHDAPGRVEVTLPGTGNARAEVDLLPGVYSVDRTCLGALGCSGAPTSERLFGWLRIR